MKRLTWKRIKNILFGFTGTAIHCPYCKSLNVRSVGDATIKRENDYYGEMYEMTCKDCNAKGLVLELWEEE